MKKLFFVFICFSFFVVQPVGATTELSEIRAQIKQAEQQNKKIEQQVKST